MMGTNRQRKREEMLWEKERDDWMTSFKSKITLLPKYADNYPYAHIARDCDICADDADFTYYNLRFICKKCFQRLNWTLFKPRTADHMNFETLMTDMYRRLPVHKQVARHLKYGPFEDMWGDKWSRQLGEQSDD